MAAELEIRRIRCPAAGCGLEFDVHGDRLGRAVSCPGCGRRLTARPIGVERQLRLRQERVTGGVGAPRSRLPLAVLLDNVRSLWNVGSIFRTADACDVERLLLSGITGQPPRPQIAKTALGAESAVGWTYHADALEALRELEQAGYTPVALESSSRSVPLDRVVWPERVGLILGNEVVGVSEPILEACALHVHIPMRGVKDSLNVAVAFGIAAYHAAGVLESRRRAANRAPAIRVAAGRVTS